MGVIHPFLQVNFSFAHKKTSDLLEKPISEFPNLDKMGYKKNGKWNLYCWDNVDRGLWMWKINIKIKITYKDYINSKISW